MKKFIVVVFVSVLLISVLLVVVVGLEVKIVVVVYKDKLVLVGKEVSVKGKVVKVNNGIMGCNFVYVQDGMGDQSSNNLIIISKQIVVVGDSIVVIGKVVFNCDFGVGYMYLLLFEESMIIFVK